MTPPSNGLQKIRKERVNGLGWDLPPTPHFPIHLPPFPFYPRHMIARRPAPVTRSPVVVLVVLELAIWNQMQQAVET